jgi:AcrR family transcriptional regulator
MPRPISPLHDQQRDLILRTAVRLFGQKGFAGTSMKELAAECQVSKPLLYHYFSEKHQLLQEIVNRYLLIHEKFVEELCKEGVPPSEALREYVRHCRTQSPDAVALYRISDQVTPQVSEELSLHIHRARLKILSMLQELVQRLVPGLPWASYRLATDALVNLSWASLEEDSNSNSREVLADFLLKGLGSLTLNRQGGSKRP